MRTRIFICMIALLCATASMEAKKVKTVVLTTVPGMKCGNCEARVKKALLAINGVKEVKTDIRDQTVTVTYNSKKVSEQQLQRPIEGTKFTLKLYNPNEAKDCCKPREGAKPAEEGCGMDNGEGCSGEHHAAAGQHKAKEECCEEKK